ncbi:flagellar basal-body rod protein FlgF [Neobacillus notoginsengisoli]|uniref:Flagellar basal-body rod protein FlgF n=1 Tax=Neobacillus notoginsengisoli TaxID=1578198 RepID=A0A417YJJ2_9BACI|nr:flagellar basal-body rod protein FlgF [Neobacillus notoginsengisoli]RHW33316.1 flagellar basal-body rod protein FlgF [Neobacillus notoginsengisoli]
MLRSLNSGVSGLKAFQTKLDVIGNNIANVNTAGFKKSRTVFEDIFSQTVKDASAPSGTAPNNVGGTNPIQVGLGTRVGSIDTVFTPGSPTTTNIGTDLYIDGDGFFQVRNSSGQVLLTRAGNFRVDENRQLVNQNGMPVLDSRGNDITIPTGYISFSISQDGTIVGVDSNGDTVTATPPVQISVVAVDNPAGLKKMGGSLYSLTANSQLSAAPSTAQIIAGTLEMSNVDLSEEMTDMITAQRGFQANAKIITVSDSVLEELVNLKR